MNKSNPQLGAYVGYTYVACHACGQLTRIEVCYPVVQASLLNKAKYCPLCGTVFEPKGRESDANGSGFLLVAAALFNKIPTKEDVALVQGIYPLWNAYEHPTFKDFVRSLVQGS